MRYDASLPLAEKFRLSSAKHVVTPCRASFESTSFASLKVTPSADGPMRL